MTNTFTKEEKQKYFQSLRSRWEEAKDLAKKDEYQAMFMEAQRLGLKVSETGFTFTKVQMENLNLDGMPYIDAKTFKGWKDSGFKVKKGEKSVIKGITFIKPKSADDSDDYMFPKMYCLFHKSQIEAI